MTSLPEAYERDADHPFYTAPVAEDEKVLKCKYCRKSYSPIEDDTTSGACGPCDEEASDPMAGTF